VKIKARVVEDGAEPVVIITGERVGDRIDATRGVEFQNATLRGCDLSGLRIPQFGASASEFDRCDFSRARVDAGSLGFSKGAVFRDCRFAGAELTRAEPGIARFERCDFQGASLDGWFGAQAEFVECTFSGRLHRMRFYGTVDPLQVADAVGRLRNEFVGNDFEAAELTDVEFVGGIDLRAQRLPPGPEYVLIDDLPERLRRAHEVVAGWPVGPERTIALDEIAVLRAVYRDQPAIFRRRDQTIPEFERIWQTVEAVNL